MHHRPRYARYPQMGLLLGPDTDTDAEDLEITEHLWNRMARNMKSSSPSPPWRPLPRRRPLMSSLLLLNGSPRGPRSNSMRMLEHVAEGWVAAGGAEPVVLHLARRADYEQAVTDFASADVDDTVLLGMPLYTDSMPGLVAELFEALAPHAGRAEARAGLPRAVGLLRSAALEGA